MLSLTGSLQLLLCWHQLLLLSMLCAAINAALEEFFPVGCGVKIIAEPGEHVSPGFLLCSAVPAQGSVPLF